jgi:hypothetical protein
MLRYFILIVIADDLVQQYSQVRSRPKAPQKSIQSISNWFANHENAILEEETDYIQKTHDLFQVVPRQTSQLRAFLEQSSRFRLMSIWEKRSLDEDTIHYIADRRIDAFINGLTTIIGFVMLTAPLWTLAWVKPMASRLGIITAFIFLFLVLVNTLSVARPFEVLAATAAYVYFEAGSDCANDSQICCRTGGLFTTCAIAFCMSTLI